MKPTLPLSGSCHCGALRYQLKTAPLIVYCCHCTNCQKISGSAFALSTIIAESGLDYTQGAPARVQWTADSGTARFGDFCGECGVRIAHGQTPSNGFLSLRGGTLGDTSWLRSAGHIWTSSAQAWVSFDEDDLLYDRQPTDYNPLAQRFASFKIFGDA